MYTYLFFTLCLESHVARTQTVLKLPAPLKSLSMLALTFPQTHLPWQLNPTCSALLLLYTSVYGIAYNGYLILVEFSESITRGICSLFGTRLVAGGRIRVRVGVDA